MNVTHFVHQIRFTTCKGNLPSFQALEILDAPLVTSVHRFCKRRCFVPFVEIVAVCRRQVCDLHFAQVFFFLRKYAVPR